MARAFRELTLQSLGEICHATKSSSKTETNSKSFPYKAASGNGSDGEGRKRGEQTGLDTPVVHAVNDAPLMSRLLREDAVS